MTVKSVIEVLNKLNKRIKQYICLLYCNFSLVIEIISMIQITWVFDKKSIDLNRDLNHLNRIDLNRPTLVFARDSIC